MNDIEYSKMRLEKILASQKLNYNPYKVSDKELIQTFNSFTWGNSFEITDCVIVSFKEIRRLEWINPFDALVYTLGSWSNEEVISINRFLDEINANDSKMTLRTTLDGKSFDSRQQVKLLVGKTVLISHYIQGKNSWGNFSNAYNMHTLSVDVEMDSKIIKTETYKSNIKMLQRLLRYPECSDYIFCNKSLFDIETPIKQKIDFIKAFPNVNK